MDTGSSSSAEVPLSNERAVDAADTRSSAEESPARQGERTALSILQRFAVFSVAFGPGAATATYTSLFGWYQQQYHTSEILIWMRLALFAPFPIIKVLQQRYDAHFDEMYSTESTYLFRLVIMQVVISLLMIIWMFLPLQLSASEAIHPILIFGVVLGTCVAPFIGSSIQVAVAMDPVFSIWAQLGYAVGMTVPVAAMWSFGFKPESSHAELCRILAVPLMICVLVSFMLGSWHFSGIFHPAYNTITRRRSLQLGIPPEGVSNPQDDEGEPLLGDNRIPVPRSQGASADAAEELDEGYPLWVKLWLGMQTCGIGLDFFMLTLIGYFGDSDTTQQLATWTLIGSLAGRLMALLWSYLPAFKQGPMHISAAFLFVLRVHLWIVLLLQFFKVLHLSPTALVAVWSLWITFGMLHNSMTDMSVTSNVKDSQTQTVAQLSVSLNYSALFFGLATASAMVLSGYVGDLKSSVGVTLLSSSMAQANYVAQFMSLK